METSHEVKPGGHRPLGSWPSGPDPDAHPLPPTAARQQDWPDRLARLACAALDARLAGLGLTSVEGNLVELANCPGESADWACPRDITPLLRYVLDAGDYVRLDQLTVAGSNGSPCAVGPFLGVRLYYNGQCGGALFVARHPDDPPFTPRDERTVAAFRTFLEQHDLAEDTHLLVRVRLMHQIAQATSLDPDLRKPLQFALRELGRHLPMTPCAVWLHEESTDELVLSTITDPPTVSWTPGRLAAGLRLPLAESPFAGCFRDRQTLYMDRLREADSPWLREWGEHGAVACLAVPLSCGQNPVGLLQCLCTRPAGFTQAQIHLVCAVADLLGPAISNFQLYDRLNQAYQQLQAAQQQLINAEKMRALGELASGMAHDFNNALCGTLGFVELVLKDPTLSTSVRDYLNMAKTCAIDAATTVRRVQDFARWERGIRDGQLIDPNELVRTTAELTKPKWQDLPQARSRTIELELCTEAQSKVMGNPSELREVLTNLVFNAVDAMPDGGKLTLSTSSTNAAVFIRVADTGIGMTKEVQQRLFEPFFSTKKERGTGLGLSVSYAIVKRHGGTITVASEVGRGTTFTIQLPAATVSPNHPAEAPPPVPGGLRILVIDDEPHVLLFLKQSLHRLGHHAETATSGLDGVARFQRETFDLVITDLGMPNMNGTEVARTIRQIHPAVPIILLTGWADQLAAGGEQPPGVDLVLGKPLTLEQLTTALAKACQARSPQ
jgi:signal transduction histidine kinase